MEPIVVESKAQEKPDSIKALETVGVLLTPPIDKDYWLYRVAVSDNQAIVAFPKFMTIGIGFQHEEDWNTNLPYTCPAKEIYDHISHNSRGADEQRCIAAIEAIQKVISQSRE